MNKILAALVSMLMILGTIAPVLAETTMVTAVTDPDTTININTALHTGFGAVTDGSVVITATLTDVNGDDDIALTGYSVTADSPLDVSSATFGVVVNPVDNQAVLTVSEIVVPYTTSPGTDYTITVTTADGTTDSIDITVVSVVAVSATNVNFGDAIPGGPSKIGLSTITNEGNVVVDFDDYGDVGYNNNVDDEITWSALTGSGLDDILATAITTSYDGVNIAVDSTGDVSFTLTVPEGILSGARTGTVTFAPSVAA